MPNGEQSGRRDEQNEADDAMGVASRGSITQPSAANRSASAAQRLTVLGEMTAGIAHDFRNILAVIDSGLRLAENHSGNPGAVCTFIAGAREGVTRGLMLTSQLLTFAKQRELQSGTADVNELLKALELFLRYGAGSEVRVVFELSPSIPYCLVDPSQFNAAILNLVINARDAMPKGGEVQISTALRAAESAPSDAGPVNYVRVRVRDNGSGMSEDVLKKIFQPFFTTKGELGTGLGVSQVGAFVRGIGGHVYVASDPGQGTTFDLFLPAVGSSRDRPRRIASEATMRPVNRLSFARQVVSGRIDTSRPRATMMHSNTD
jgi:signal transduction histidine kinase